MADKTQKELDERKRLKELNEKAMEEFFKNGGKVQVLPPAPVEDKQCMRSMSPSVYVDVDSANTIDNMLAKVDENRDKIDEYFTRLVNNNEFPNITEKNVESVKREFINSVLQGTAGFMSLSDADDLFGEKRKSSVTKKAKKLPDVDMTFIPDDLLAELGIKSV